MVFQVTSTASRISDSVILLPEPELGMVADVVSGNERIGQRVVVEGGRWCHDVGGECPEHWVAD
jgi:hypothetical protein